MKAPRCYCGAAAQLRHSRYGPFWSCTRWPDCDGTVGCHPGTTTPLGTMADAETRRARAAAHDAFDALWQPLGKPYRGIAYRWLGEELCIDDPHMGEMDAATARRVVELCGGLGPEDLEDYRQQLDALEQECAP